MYIIFHLMQYVHKYFLQILLLSQCLFLAPIVLCPGKSRLMYYSFNK